MSNELLSILFLVMLQVRQERVLRQVRQEGWQLLHFWLLPSSQNMLMQEQSPVVVLDILAAVASQAVHPLALMQVRQV